MEDEGAAEDDDDADDDEGDGRRHDHLDDFGKGGHGGRVSGLFVALMRDELLDEVECCSQ